MIIVVSDTHFGVEPTNESRESTIGMKELLSFIRENRPKKIILLGDVFDFYRCDVVDAIEAGRRKFFSGLDEILKGFPCDIVYVIGNHDHFFRQKKYMDDTSKRMDTATRIGEIDEELIEAKRITLAEETLKSLLTHARGIEAKYPHHTESISGKTFFFEHGDYTDYLFFYGGGWERYLYPFLKKKEERTDLPHIMEYLESLASIRNTASYYQKIEEHLHSSLESIQRNITVSQERRFAARLTLALLSISIFLILPVLFFLFGIADIILVIYFVGLASAWFLYLFFKERFLQKLGGLLVKSFIDAFGPSRGEKVEDLVSGRLSSKMFKMKGKKSYMELVSERAGCAVDFYVFGHVHHAGFAKFRKMGVMNAGCWSRPNDDEANRLAERARNVENREEIKERLYRRVEEIGDWREGKTLVVIEEHGVSIKSLHDGQTKFSQAF